MPCEEGILWFYVWVPFTELFKQLLDINVTLRYGLEFNPSKYFFPPHRFLWYRRNIISGSKSRKIFVGGNIYPLIFIKFFISRLQWILSKPSGFIYTLWMSPTEHHKMFSFTMYLLRTLPESISRVDKDITSLPFILPPRLLQGRVWK